MALTLLETDRNLLPSKSAWLQELDNSAALCIKHAVGDEQCASWVKSIYAQRDQWVSDFNAVQYSLGRAWYTHYEQGRSRDYFLGAKQSDQLVQTTTPGLQETLVSLTQQIVNGEVRQRQGWCGPGVHIFPAGKSVSHSGGDIHFDLEGLTEAHAAAQKPAYSLILMLQAPLTGGGLKLWDVYFDGERSDLELDDDELDCETTLFEYKTGDLLIVDSYRLHQIQPFSGDVDRISATAHIAQKGTNRWEIWF